MSGSAVMATAGPALDTSRRASSRTSIRPGGGRSDYTDHGRQLPAAEPSAHADGADSRNQRVGERDQGRCRGRSGEPRHWTGLTTEANTAAAGRRTSNQNLTASRKGSLLGPASLRLLES